MKLSFVTLFALTAAASAGFSPVFTLVNPRGGQRGTTVDVVISGDRLDGLQELMFYEPGITVAELDIKDPKNVRAKLNIAPDARLGEYSLRARTEGGLSVLKSFFVGQFPTVMEAEPNNTFDQPQKVELNTTVQGVSGNEDEDFYIVSLKKGQRLSVEVEGMRLGRTMFDTYVAILDPKRFEIAACDDAPLLRSDSFASVIAPEDGDYRVVVREAAYEGSDACQYRLHIGNFPRPKAIHPLGGKPGETIEFSFFGDPSGVIKKTVTLPPNAISPFPVFAEHDGLLSPSPHWITVSPLEHVEESGDNSTQQGALAMPAIPSAAQGVLTTAGKTDWYKFTAKKDENLVIKVIARELRSPLDSTIAVFNDKAKRLGLNDDQGGPDSTLPWNAPADGEYFLEISDQLKRGGEDFSYRIEVQRKAPSFTASLPTVERNNSQKWKTFSVPKGNRYAAVVNVARQNNGADMVFESAALPPGITMTAAPIPKNVTTFPVIFEAAADAPIGSSFATFQVRPADPAKDAVPPAPLRDEIAHIEINNQGTYHGVTLDKIATAVVSEVPFKLELEPLPTPLVKDGVVSLKVKVARNEGYAEPINVRFLWSPPGVSAPVTIDIPGDKSEGLYELNANTDAAVGEWPVCVLAEAKAPGGPVIISSGFTPLKVAEPMVAITFDLAATEQGRPLSVIGKIDKQQEFEGTATAELVGLPSGTKSVIQNFTKDQTEINFPIEVAADAAVGKHTTIFCKVNIPLNGGMVLHQTAKNTTLRIDKPIAPIAKADDKPNGPAPAPAPAPAAGEKPLSRLEQLRKKSQ